MTEKRMKMKEWIIPFLVLMVIVCSGCIQSDISKINKLAGDINQHLKKGDEYYNEAAEDVNNFRFDSALGKCELASTEYNSARLLASEAFSYAQSSGDEVFINYMQLLLAEIDAKLNATSELKNAVQLFGLGENKSANGSLELANKFMKDAKNFEKKRNDIVDKNPEKFNI